MSQCIRLNCKDLGWIDPDNHDRRSYFCLKHAYAAARGHLIFTPPQWAIFNKEGFEDALVPEQCGYGKKIAQEIMFETFPLDFITHWRVLAGQRTPHRGFDPNMCCACGKTIISGRKRCGKCRRKAGLPDDEVGPGPMTRCGHWRNIPEPGHVYLRNCKFEAPLETMRDVHGELWCPGCVMYVFGIDRDARRKHGYIVH